MTPRADMIAREGGARIGAGMRVTLHFAIHLESGEEVDTTRRGRPAVFDVGDGSLPPGFENSLIGLRAGDDRQLCIAPQEGFGMRRPENVRTLRRADFPAGSEPATGAVIAFAGPGGEIPGVVRGIRGEQVEVDFNHPLAGRELIFDVTILRVEKA